MGRNQRNDAVRARFRSYALTFSGAAVIALMGLGLVHQHNLQHDLAREAQVIDRNIDRLEEKLRHATRVEATLKSPLMLEQRIRELNLGLMPIVTSQRLYVARPAVEWPPVTPAMPPPGERVGASSLSAQPPLLAAEPVSASPTGRTANRAGGTARAGTRPVVSGRSPTLAWAPAVLRQYPDSKP